MSRTLTFPVPAGVIEGLNFVMAERRRIDPSALSRDAFLAQLVQDAIAAQLRLLQAAALAKADPVAPNATA